MKNIMKQIGENTKELRKSVDFADTIGTEKYNKCSRCGGSGRMNVQDGADDFLISECFCTEQYKTDEKLQEIVNDSVK